jgi:hypothetical protein
MHGWMEVKAVLRIAYSNQQKAGTQPKLDLSNIVMIWIPDRPVLEWSFSGHFLSPVFERSGILMPDSTRGPVFEWSTRLDSSF